MNDAGARYFKLQRFFCDIIPLARALRALAAAPRSGFRNSAPTRGIAVGAATGRMLSVLDLERTLSGFSRLEPSTAHSILAFYDGRRQGAPMPAPARAS
jgi:hypothetical protein